MRTRENRQADHIGVLVTRAGGDLLGCESDSGVDHFHAGVTRRHRDLFGTVGVAVETGLGHQQFGRSARNRAHELGDTSQFTRPLAHCGRHTRRSAELSEHVAQYTRPFAGGTAGLGQRDGGFHDVGAVVGGPTQFVESLGDGLIVALTAPCVDVVDRFAFDRGIDLDDLSFTGERRILRLGVRVHAHDYLFAGFDSTSALGHRLHESTLQHVDGFERATERENLFEFGPRCVADFRGSRLDHF